MFYFVDVMFHVPVFSAPRKPAHVYLQVVRVFILFYFILLFMMTSLDS